MRYLLNLVYLLLILVSLPWLLWQAIRKGKYREGYAAKFFGRVPQRTSGKTRFWLHAVSVGEVNLLAPLLKRIREVRPDWECVISTTTATGMALAKKKYAATHGLLLPAGFLLGGCRGHAPHSSRRTGAGRVGTVAQSDSRGQAPCGAKVAVVNGRLGEKSFRGYRRIRPLVSRLLRQIDLIAVQDETYAERFRALGLGPSRSSSPAR